MLFNSIPVTPLADLPPSAPDELIVGFGESTSQGEMLANAEQANAVVVERLGSIDALVVKPKEGSSSESLARELDGMAGVRYVEPNYTLELLSSPNDPRFSDLWGLNNSGQNGGTTDADIDAPEAWDTSTGGSVVVAISDTGIDYTHPDLQDNIWSNSDEMAGNGIDDDGNGYVDDVRGYDFINNDADPYDDHSHGTHVSGTIGAVGNNGVGVTGVNWSTKLMGVKFLSAGGWGWYSDAVKSIDYASANGARVINASWGGNGNSQALKDAIERAGDRGTLFVAAAGNSGRNADRSPMYPAAYDLDNIVSVAASTRYETLAWFSNYGRTSVDLAAPGYDVTSTVPGSTYSSYSGTSMASPHVAGAAALYLAGHPDETPSTLRRRLIATADVKSAYEDKMVSDGRLNLASLLASEGEPPADDPSQSCPESSSSAAGSSATSPAEAARQLVVGFKSSASARQERRVVDRAGGSIDERLGSIDAVVVDVDEGLGRKQVESRLERFGAVEYAEPNGRLEIERTPNDPYFYYLWGMNNSAQFGGSSDADIDAPEAWESATDASSITVAVTDTGIDNEHADLEGNIWSNSDEVACNGVDDDGNGYIDDTYGYDFYNNDSDPYDDHSHGTHVAGTIGANGNNGTGVAGVAWNTKLMALKFLSSWGGGSLSDGVKAINYATDNGAKVINASWGGGGYYQSLYDAIERAGNNGVLFVAAAGNSGVNADTSPMYPAAYDLDNIVSVAASTYSESLAYFSNYGQTSVDLAAPGYFVLSTVPGNYYSYYSGTSMASPHVAGAAAMYLAGHPSEQPSTLRRRLIATVDHKRAFFQKTVSGGRLNLASLLASEGEPPDPDPNQPCNETSGSSASQASSASEATRQLVVGFKPSASASQERRAVDRAGGSIDERLGSIDAVVVDADEGISRKQVENRLESYGVVRYAEPNARLKAFQTPNDTYFSSLWGLNNSGQFGGISDADIDAPEAWDSATDSSNTTVAVIDTGVDYSHTDLEDNMWQNPDEVADNCIDDDGNGYVDDVYGYDFYNLDEDPFDDHSHGTHVAGTIGASGNNGTGVAGVGWKSKIMAVKFLSRWGYGSLSDAVKAIDYATTNGAKVINASWGGGGYYQSLYDAIDRAGNSGVLFVAAAGNSGYNADYYPMYPAAYELNNIVSVAASTYSETLAYFSNYGKTSVDLAAPGYLVLSSVPGNSYSYYSGTSMAAPHVAGAAALYLASHPSEQPSTLRRRLIATADQKRAYRQKTVSGGRLNLASLLASEGDPPDPTDPCDSSSGQSSPTSATEATRQLVVGFKPSASASQERRAVDRAGGSIDERLGSIDAVVVEADKGVARRALDRRLERLHLVEYAEPNAKLKSLRSPNDSYFSSLWGLHNSGQDYATADADIDAPEAWELATDASNITVAITDTGIDYNHPDLIDNIWTNPSEVAGNCRDDDGNGYTDDVYGYDFFNNDEDPYDDHSHGTHVAGTIGATGDNGLGVAGVNWRVKLMAVKFLSGGGYGYLSDAVKAIDYATANGAKVINASWGGGGWYQSLYDAIARAGQNGVLFVAAAGNSGMNADYNPMYPAAYGLGNIVSVAASTKYETLAYFSNYGQTSVDLAAPGYYILSTIPENSYGQMSGTSMASPHVAGAAALYLSRHPSVSPSELRQALIASADTKTAYEGMVASNGRLNLAKLLGVGNPDSTQPPTESKPTPTQPPRSTPKKRGKKPPKLRKPSRKKWEKGKRAKKGKKRSSKSGLKRRSRLHKRSKHRARRS